MEKTKSGLNLTFLESIKNYGKIQTNKMSLKDRIQKLKEQYVPINNIEMSNPVERSLDMSTISSTSRTGSLSSNISNLSDKNTIKSEN